MANHTQCQRSPIRQERSYREIGKGAPAMPLLQLVIVLVVVGVILWVINSYIPMQATIEKILNVVVIGRVILWLLSVFGIIDSLRGIQIDPFHQKEGKEIENDSIAQIFLHCCFALHISWIIRL
jgi:hypothetical protein